MPALQMGIPCLFLHSPCSYTIVVSYKYMNKAFKGNRRFTGGPGLLICASGAVLKAAAPQNAGAPWHGPVCCTPRCCEVPHGALYKCEESQM
jgi:hypothetical protein